MTTNPENTNNNYGNPATNGAPQAPQYDSNAYGQVPAGYGQSYGADPMVQQAAKSSNTMGLWAVILSCVGILFGLLAFVGIGLGIAANSKAKQAIVAGVPAEQTGKGKAKAAIIIGIIVVVLNIAVGIYFGMNS